MGKNTITPIEVSDVMMVCSVAVFLGGFATTRVIEAPISDVTEVTTVQGEDFVVIDLEVTSTCSPMVDNVCCVTTTEVI